jgi:hypothetical protein
MFGGLRMVEDLDGSPPTPTVALPPLAWPLAAEAADQDHGVSVKLVA